MNGDYINYLGDIYLNFIINLDFWDGEVLLLVFIYF